MSDVDAYNLFSEEQQDEILRAIEHAEKTTSGEIRVHIQNSCKGDLLDHAAFVFARLGMHKTNLRNGVLIYIAVEDHKLAILGDAGINKLVGPNFWNSTLSGMQVAFSSGKAHTGLVNAIQEVGNLLSEYFPYQSDDVNELTNEISFSKE